MSKEQQQIIDEAYKNYEKKYWELDKWSKIEYGSSCYIHDANEYNFETLSKEQFIDKCRTNQEFSKQWGLKIKERELSLEEREDYFVKNILGRSFIRDLGYDVLDEYNIPTKLITVTYNNKTIESYEI
jgi:hypothetical protein